jgi:soluble lytic murein transglycosylase-like protein
MMHMNKIASLTLGLAIFTAAAGQGAADDRPDRCVASAAQTHRVNPDILRAILMVESRMNPGVVSKNSNGTIDVGIAGINSIHFRELSRHGISQSDLMDPCVSTFVAAWKVSKKMAKWGNTWFGVAAYHSETPYYNNRYQVMLFNEMVRSGVIRGSIQKVPPLRRP